MCMNCVSIGEAIAVQAAFVGYAIKGPVHRMLASAGLARELDPVAHDARTVAFLRSLDLDPVEILGHDAVSAAAGWELSPRPSRVRARDSALPMGSHSLLTAQ